MMLKKVFKISGFENSFFSSIKLFKQFFYYFKTIFLIYFMIGILSEIIKWIIVKKNNSYVNISNIVASRLCYHIFICISGHMQDRSLPKNIWKTNFSQIN